VNGEILRYNFKLAARNIRRNPILSSLMVAAIAVGIGASMSMLTVNYSMSANPIPHKSDVLYYVQLDSWDPNRAAREPDEPPDQMTYLDATALMRAGKAFRQIASSSTSLAVEPAGQDERPFFVDVRATHADFFPMFDVPFEFGGGWPPSADAAEEQVVVLSAAINERVFGGEDSVGRVLTLSGENYRIVGVLEEWEPVPKFYDVTTGAFDAPEEIFIPWSLIVAKQLPRTGNTNCWKPVDGDGFEAFLSSECIWIQFWAELRTETEKEEYMSFLDAYATEQKALGRFPRPLNNRLRDVMEWLEFREIVPAEAQVLLGLSVIFLAVCLLNTIGLLLAKFLGKAPEIGIRRALGASRSALFQQYLVESGLIGLAGGVVGLGLGWLGLRGIEALFGDFARQVVQMDWVMVATALVLAVGASLVTALYPTWRACNVQPAAYLSAH
jgi:putative ABC transport system permease protein